MMLVELNLDLRYLHSNLLLFKTIFENFNEIKKN